MQASSLLVGLDVSAVKLPIQLGQSWAIQSWGNMDPLNVPGIVVVHGDEEVGADVLSVAQELRRSGQVRVVIPGGGGD